MKQDDQRADATQADAANRRADANRADAVADERNFDDAVEAVVKRLEANRANTLALCACLAICETRMPYREAEALIGQRPELNLSTQNAHALLRIMIDCGGVETEEVPEPACEPGDDKQDQPVDYTVRTTEAGRAALAQFEPTKRFGRMLQDEPAGYAQAYAIVLALCDIDDFKLINDVRGHQAGDIAIVCIADILDDLSGNHPVIRWGGEELLLVLFSTPDHEALRLCNQMREEVASYPISDDLGDFSCTLTFGLSAYDPELTFGENFASADRALYHGKETGKNRCVFAQSNQIERDGGNRS